MTPRDNVLAWARGNSPIAVHPAYIRMAGDVGAGVLLSQIVYWHSDTKEGQRRGGVDRDGETWVAKPAGEWARELGLDPDSGQGPAKVVRRYLTHLQAAGLVETDVFKFNGTPTLHVRVRWENFDAPLESGNGISENPEMESPEIHIRKMDFPTVGKSSKEAETTSETTNYKTPPNGGGALPARVGNPSDMTERVEAATGRTFEPDPVTAAIVAGAGDPKTNTETEEPLKAKRVDPWAPFKERWRMSLNLPPSRATWQYAQKSVSVAKANGLTPDTAPDAWGRFESDAKASNEWRFVTRQTADERFARWLGQENAAAAVAYDASGWEVRR